MSEILLEIRIVSPAVRIIMPIILHMFFVGI